MVLGHEVLAALDGVERRPSCCANTLLDQRPNPHFAFVIGYNVDSFIEIFLGRFTGDMKKATALLEGRYTRRT